MDDLDSRIIALLRMNARESVAEIARQLKISRSTVQDRISRLEKAQVIKGYSLDLKEEMSDSGIRAFVTTSVQPQETAMIIAELKAFNFVNAVHTVSGKYDLQLEVATPDTEQMDRMIDRITEIPGVLKTETSIVLSTKFKR